MLLLGVVFAVVYDAPSCTDGKQNQDETGIDCGGSCRYVCTATQLAPRTVFARAVTNASGRTDVIAYIENRNLNESKDAAYLVEVFSEDGELLGSEQGTLDLPARSIVPIFLAGVVRDTGALSQAFVSFESESLRWEAPKQQVTSQVSIESAVLVDGSRPRITATVRNSGPEPVFQYPVIATVFDAEGIAIAASRTVLREVPGYGTVEAVFTWTAPFAGAAARIEVLAVPQLP